MAEPVKKTFSLKQNESEIINNANRRYNMELASLFSFIAIERLAYPVDENTAFQVSGDLKSMEIWQNEPAEEVVDVGKLSTTGSGEVAKALKGKK